jgi:sugar-specific transcriptional regulator TrmB
MEKRIVSVLKSVGLTDVEASIYISLLQHGPGRAGAIAKNTGFHRRTVYDAVEKLVSKGIVGYSIKNNQKLFEAADPNILKNLLKEKEVLLEEIMPRLSTMRLLEKPSEAKIFTGRHGLKTVFEDQIREGREILIYGASPLAYNIFKLYFKWYDARRQEEKIRVKAVFASSIRSRLKKIPLAELRFLPDRYMGPVALNIYGNKVSMVLWSKEEPFVVLVDNKEMADSYRKFFELAWKRAKN